MTLPSWINADVLNSTLFTVLICLGLYRSSQRMQKYQRAVWVAILIVGAWFAVSILVGLSGVLHTGVGERPRIPIPLIGGFVTAYLLSTRVKAFREIIAAIPVTWLVGFQLLRIVGGSVLLLLFAQGFLPFVFAVPVGLTDALVGLLALPLLYLWRNQHPAAPGLTRAWAILGILDHVGGIVMATLTGAGPLMNLTPWGGTNLIMDLFPLVLIPSFRIPLALLINVHLLHNLGTLRRLAAPASQQPAIAQGATR